MDSILLKELAYKSLLELSHEEGFSASGKEEIYGCIFGRDTALTVLKILKAHKKTALPELVAASRRALLTLTRLQGKTINIESGEEPGKFIHEFRRNKFDHLINSKKPWYVYPEGVLKNYDSIDSTPLALIAIYRFWEATDDEEFMHLTTPAVKAGLKWIITTGDRDHDYFLEYEVPSQRVHGGLTIHSWTDSTESLLTSQGTFPVYPIAPVEAQSYAWLALKLWANYFKAKKPLLSVSLETHAKNLKSAFNKYFIFEEEGYYFAGQALDGLKNPIKTVTGNPLICLWATYKKDGKRECIIRKKYIKSIVQRAFLDDLFDNKAGIRTMSKRSKTYNPNQDSYHNGSFWPILNGLITEGLENWEFKKLAKILKEASLAPIIHFKSPIELYIKTESGELLEYRSPSGQTGCKTQAWTAATTLDWLT